MIAFVTYPDGPELSDDDSLLREPLLDAGIDWQAHSWDAPGVAWDSFDAVIMRSTWDYYVRQREFSAWLDARATDGTRLWNPPAVLRWNMHKGYLRALERSGVNTVPTEWLTETDSLSDLMRSRGWERAVVKPAVSGAAHRTKVVSGSADDQRFLDDLLVAGEVMVQPFLDAIVEEGEWSLVFFDHRFSHALVKLPKPGDFRVQQLHGGTTEPAEPTPTLVEQARQALDGLPEQALYARVDGVRTDSGLMTIELEVLEPVLYFETSNGSAARFVEAILRRL